MADGFDIDNIDNLLKSAQTDLENSKSSGITQEDLDKLNQHEGANMWTSLFMNLIGRSNGVNPEPFSKPLQQKVEQEKQALLLKNQLANQQAQRAGQTQNFGLGQLKAGEAIAQQRSLQSPTTPTQANIISRLKTLGGIENEDNSDIQNQMQYRNAVPDLEKVAQLQNMRFNYNKPELKQDKSGNWVPVDRYTGVNFNNSAVTNEMDPSKLKFDDKGKIINPDDSEKGVQYTDISSGKNNLTPNQQKTALSQLPKIQSDYQKNYGISSNQFNQKLDALESSLDQAMKGNYVAARSLPAKEARLFEDLGSGRITNFDIQMQKDPHTSGLLNSLQGKIQGILGNGNVTPMDAKYIQDVVNELREIHNKNLTDIQEQYRTKANSVVGSKFNDDSYLFGMNPKTNQQLETPSQNTYQRHGIIHADDYLNSLGK